MLLLQRRRRRGPGHCGSTAATGNTDTSRQRIRWLGSQIAAYQKATWRWERLMGVPLVADRGPAARGDEHRRTSSGRSGSGSGGPRRPGGSGQKPPHLAAFLCIHRYEGSWRDGGGPYYGGLQMDLGFQRTYAPWLLRTKGTADHWTPLEQIWTAEKAARSRGFWPWPNTARSCGLL